MNNKYLTILSLVVLLTSFNTYAQEVIYSPYNKIDFRTSSFSVVGNVGGRTYTYRGSSEGYYLDAYDVEMQHKATVILDFIPRKAFGIKFITYPDKMLMLYQINDGGLIIQYGARLDATGRLIDEPFKIDEVATSFISGRNGVYRFATSKSKEHIVVYATGTKGANLNLKVIWLDDELKKQSVSETGFSADNNVSIGEAIVNGDGKFFLPAFTLFGSRDYADRIWLLSMPIGGTEVIEAELPLNDLFAAGMFMKIDRNDNKIYVGGFYSDKKNGHFQGVLYTYYDVIAQAFKGNKAIPFSEKLRNATGDRNKKRAFNDFRVKELIVKNDGGFVLIAENFFMTTRSGYAQGFGYYSWYYPTMASSVREYNYGDILTISCDGTGKPEWTKFIRKYQYSQEDGGLFSSYALVNTGGALGFLFNDFSLRQSTVQLASLDVAGKLSMIRIQQEVDNADWLPRSGKQISANEFVLPCLKRNQICFAKIVF